VNTGKLKFAVHVLKQGNFLDPTDEVMSNTAKILMYCVDSIERFKGNKVRYPN